MVDDRQESAFISFVSENREEVQALCHELTLRGVRVCVDRNEIRQGVSWKTALHDSICRDGFFIPCFSKEYDSRADNLMNEEIGFVFGEMKRFGQLPIRRWFVPVFFSQCVPDFNIGERTKFSDIDWPGSIFLYEDWDFGIQRIMWAIRPGPSDMPDLIKALSSPGPKVRYGAAQALGEIRDPAAVPALVAGLRDKHPDVRMSVADALGAIGCPEAIPALRDALGAQDLNAVWAVVAIGGSAAVDALTDALRGTKSNPYVFTAALAELGSISVRSLISTLSNEVPDVRASVARALGKIGDPAAVPALQSALLDENPDVRREVAEALGEIGDPVAIPALRSALSDEDPSVRRYVAYALRSLGVAVPGLEKCVCVICSILQELKERESSAAATEPLPQDRTPDK